MTIVSWDLFDIFERDPPEERAWCKPKSACRAFDQLGLIAIREGRGDDDAAVFHFAIAITALVAYRQGSSLGSSTAHLKKV